MTKQEEFLWIVQTAVLANGINLATDADTRETYRDAYSSTGVRMLMREAIRASGMTPADMDAGDAADDYCIWMFRNHRDEVISDDSRANVPSWFAR